ncbi:type II toxin-antitoxin system HicB family antitoxin [Nitrincola sp. MINF-07-Sa-05]|uniref:type II toxin-antitoxin system HicB family antitoxin n=1 Tax=Nitrincola salilacus TaxID=3400273 RepID=UPI003917ECF1
MAKDIDRYTYRVTWSEEDQEHVGLCAEFPSLSWLAEDPELALKGIRQLVHDCTEDMRQNNETVPEPLASKQFSGKFMVRVPPETHRLLAIEAAESGVSLNRLISSKLHRPRM